MLQFIFFSLLSLFGTPKDTAGLTITIPNIKDPKGEIVIAVYDRSDKFPKVGMDYTTLRFPAKTAGSTFRIENLSPGDYAVAMYHDVNSDNECNTNFLGIPKEGYGFSNNIRPLVSAPTYNECKIHLSGEKHITVHLIY